MEISCHKVGFYTCPSRAIDSCKIKVFKLVRNFGYNHPGLTNIFKFTKKEIVAAVDKHIEDNC